MALEHATLTGSQVHEPKYIEAASAGQVYVANGSGSGVWASPTAAILNQNHYYLTSHMEDISTSNGVLFFIPVKSTLRRLNVMLYGAVDANTVLSIYINGVL